MLIIKPHGRSNVNKAADRKRTLRLTDSPKTDISIPEFILKEDMLTLAQWISVLDKIARKPKMGNGATPDQRKFRERLGNAVWDHFKSRELLTQKGEKELRLLQAHWKRKVHPYEGQDWKPEKENQKPPHTKAWWYDAFCDDQRWEDADPAPIVEKMHAHLYDQKLTRRGSKANEKRGLILSRANSIENSVAPLSKLPEGEKWTSEDEARYFASDVAAQIYKAATEERIDPSNGNKKLRPEAPTVSLAAKILSEHFADVFADNAGAVPSRQEIRDNGLEGLLSLHDAAKESYKRLLKRSKKTSDAKRKVLPQNKADLLSLIRHQRLNRDLNSMIRLGKLIHYEANLDTIDTTTSPGNPLKWPDDLSQSWFLSSQGQATIKRNEAFVRIWRQALCFAARSLHDWADPENQIDDDILKSGNIDTAIQTHFDPIVFRAKAELLFGKATDFFGAMEDDSKNQAILEFLLRKTAQLRNASFHFKGRKDFVDGVAQAMTKKIDKDAANIVFEIAEKIMKSDQRAEADRVFETLAGAGVHEYLDQKNTVLMIKFVRDTPKGTIPLPRFKRVLVRAENAKWKQSTQGRTENALIPPRSADDLKSRPLLAQYTALKLLYEGPFRAWFFRQSYLEVNKWIAASVQRATDQAKKINKGGKSQDEIEIIAARADKIPLLQHNETVADFFSNLTAHTATEMRVQRGYTSDGEATRTQARYIEDLKCDVIGRAFEMFLSKTNALGDTLLKINTATPSQTDPYDPLKNKGTGSIADSFDWQHVLYMVLHLIPVDEVSRLLNQIRRWDLLSSAEKTHAAKGEQDMSEADVKERIKNIQAVFELFLNMHDAKFSGGSQAVSEIEGIEDFFEDGTLDLVFPSVNKDEADDRRIPIRGLREMKRHGHLSVFKGCFENHKVTMSEVRRLHELQKTVEASQQTRTKIHDDWKKGHGGKLPHDQVDKYRNALADVVEHRHLATHAKLNNHVRAYSVAMTLFGRCVDFAGLWERDCYFVLLAAVFLKGQTPMTVWNSDGRSKLKAGKAVEAAQALNNVGDGIKDLLRDLDPQDALFGSNTINTRNNIAHFNMLQGDDIVIDLTSLLNQTRFMMRYDRKLKNAVAPFAKNLLEREGYFCEWQMDSDHQLHSPEIKVKQANHLGGKSILENLYGDQLVGMIAGLLAGKPINQHDIVHQVRHQ